MALRVRGAEGLGLWDLDLEVVDGAGGLLPRALSVPDPDLEVPSADLGRVRVGDLGDLLAVHLRNHLVADRAQAKHVRLVDALDRVARALRGEAAATPRRLASELELVLLGKDAELVARVLARAGLEHHIGAVANAPGRRFEQLLLGLKVEIGAGGVALHRRPVAAQVRALGHVNANAAGLLAPRLVAMLALGVAKLLRL